MFLLSGCQLKELEDMLSDVYTTSQFVDTALDSGTDTQLILVKKQVLQYIHIVIWMSWLRSFAIRSFALVAHY